MRSQVLVPGPSALIVGTLIAVCSIGRAVEPSVDFNLPEILLFQPLGRDGVQALWALDPGSGRGRWLGDFIGDRAEVHARLGGGLAFIETQRRTPWGTVHWVGAVDVESGEIIQFPPLEFSSPLYLTASPDGRRVAFVHSARRSREGEKEHGLWGFDLEEFELKLLLEGALRTRPQWSADSRRIVVSKSVGYVARHRLVIVDFETGEVTETDHRGAGAAFSPDGRTIAYSGAFTRSGSWSAGVPSTGNLFLAAIDEMAATALTHYPEGGALFPSFSPSGRWLAYWRKRAKGEGPPELRAIDLSTRMDLVLATGNPFVPVQWLHGEDRILFRADPQEGKEQVAVGLIDLTGEEPRAERFGFSMPHVPEERVAASDALDRRLDLIEDQYQDAMRGLPRYEFEEAKAGMEDALELARTFYAELENADGGAQAEESPLSELAIGPGDFEPFLDSLAEAAAVSVEELSARGVAENLESRVRGYVESFYRARARFPDSVEELIQFCASEKLKPKPKSRFRFLSESGPVPEPTPFDAASASEHVRRAMMIPGGRLGDFKDYFILAKADEPKGSMVLRTPVLADGSRREAVYQLREREGRPARIEVDVREIP